MKWKNLGRKDCLLSYALLLSGILSTNAQSMNEDFGYKVDCNVARRRLAEVNIAKYQPWSIKERSSDTLQLHPSVKVIVSAKGSDKALLRSGYYKAGITQSHTAKLVCDGFFVDNGNQLELRIQGLPKGKHLIQTYHNNFSVGDDTEVPAFDVYVQGKKIYQGQKCTRRVLDKEKVLILKTPVELAHDGEEVVLSFLSQGHEQDNTRSLYLNAFEIDTPDILAQAQNPYPYDEDMHADADEGLFLRWTAGRNAVKHHIYIGTDAQSISSASIDSPFYKGVLLDSCYFMKDLYNLEQYYWRVDEEDTDGNVIRGSVWSFRPRHLAFEGAEGYGRFAIGGRGGKVVHVTNLNDDGPGSFREAVTREIGPRTIVFDVSGTIVLKSRLTCASKYVTIAGQTAPGKGICIKGAPFGVGGDGICRFIRVRLGGGKTFDGIGMAGADHSITDHCSISWTIDESFSSRGAKNITLQKTLISEALNVAGHKNYEKGKGHGYAATIGGNVGSFHHNLLAHCMGRNWSMGGGLDGNGYYSGRLDIFNNVVYNWGGRATDGGAHEVNFVNNYYKVGPSTTQMYILRAQLEGVGKGSQSYYCEGNIRQDKSGQIVTDNEKLRRYELSHGQILDWNVWVDKPFFPSYATVESAKDAYKSTLSDVGCNMPLFDEHDQRVVEETLNGTYIYVGSVGYTKGIIDNEKDAGGYEYYPEEKRDADFDTDRDGLPNWWEALIQTNPHSDVNDYSDSNADPDGDGYTNLEEYLEWMSVPHYYAENGKDVTIELASLFIAYSNPMFQVTQSSLPTVVEGSRITVKTSQQKSGIVYLKVKVKDQDDSTMTRKIGICIH